MPKVFISYPEGTFSEGALDALAEEITTAGLACEKLPDTPLCSKQHLDLCEGVCSREGLPRWGNRLGRKS